MVVMVQSSDAKPLLRLQACHDYIRLESLNRRCHRIDIKRIKRHTMQSDFNQSECTEIINGHKIQMQTDSLILRKPLFLLPQDKNRLRYQNDIAIHRYGKWLSNWAYSDDCSVQNSSSKCIMQLSHGTMNPCLKLKCWLRLNQINKEICREQRNHHNQPDVRLELQNRYFTLMTLSR